MIGFVVWCLKAPEVIYQVLEQSLGNEEGVVFCSNIQDTTEVYIFCSVDKGNYGTKCIQIYFILGMYYHQTCNF
jgi:hypothetical protein